MYFLFMIYLGNRKMYNYIICMATDFLRKTANSKFKMFMSSLLTQVDVLTAILATEEGILPVGRHKELVVSKLSKKFQYMRIIVEIKKRKLSKTEEYHFSFCTMLQKDENYQKIK
jgi:hypothetical protein